jgi:hypothetical protein
MQHLTMRKSPVRPTILQNRITAEGKPAGSSNQSNLPTPTLSNAMIIAANRSIILNMGHGSLKQGPSKLLIILTGYATMPNNAAATIR